jgi:hypothetical protein
VELAMDLESRLSATLARDVRRAAMTIPPGGRMRARTVPDKAAAAHMLATTTTTI